MTMKVRVLVLNGDTLEQVIDLDHKFIFLLVKDIDREDVYHIDSSDGNLWKANPDLSNLNHNKNPLGHDYTVRKNLGEMLT